MIPSTDVADSPIINNAHIPPSRITHSTTKASRNKTTESKIDSKKVDQFKNVKKYSAVVKDQMAENKTSIVAGKEKQSTILTEDKSSSSTNAIINTGIIGTSVSNVLQSVCRPEKWLYCYVVNINGA